MEEPTCHCGKPLHYNDPLARAGVDKLVADLGECVDVHCAGKTYIVPRHYIALHGLKAIDLPNLGFPCRPASQ